MGAISIAVHGGAGPGSALPAERESEIRAALARAVEAARATLRAGGSALDAAVEAAVVLEDCERFNAGRGAVLNADGEAQLDAAVMEGTGRRSGAVAAVQGFGNPVRIARAVLEDGRHALLAGPGAERFADAAGVPRVDPASLVTPERLAELHAHAAAARDTVGAVVRDAEGRLAAATSTGGTTGKLSGRVGDAPLVGAGTYADDATCAVSATGDGEALIRAVAAHEVAARMRLAGADVDAAAEAAIRHVQGEAGLIAMDGAGRVAMAASTAVFHRGAAVGDEPARVAVLGDEPLE